MNKRRREKLKEVVIEYDEQLAGVDKDLKELEWDIDSHSSKIENYKNHHLAEYSAKFGKFGPCYTN